VCPLEQRIAELAEREHITTAAARAMVADADRDRRAFVRDLYGKDIDDPAGYDLWVNTGTLSLDAAADIIVAALHTHARAHAHADAEAQGSANVVR
jgi:cytidylate kinase